MNMPGFTAASSLLQTSKSYYSIKRSASTAGSVYLAGLDWGCYHDCRNGCVSDCLDLIGSAKGNCIQGCLTYCRYECRY